MTPQRPRVAIVGPFYNDEAHVEPWLKAIRAQSYTTYTLYLTDDASQDHTGTNLQYWIDKLALSAQLFSLPTNRGAAGARNVAIRAALEDRADVLLLLDSDCRPQPDWVARHVALLYERPEIDILGGALNGVAHTVIGRADSFCSWFSSIPFSRSKERHRLHLSSTNMSLRASVFEDVGLFDEDLATGEDVAFCRRARACDKTLWFQSDIVVHHLDRNERAAAVRHHYRWGLHSYTLCTRAHGGYYWVLKKVRFSQIVAMLIPICAMLHTAFILWQYTLYRPKVWGYLPWIFYLKWWNAIGVLHGFRDPSLCLISSQTSSDTASPNL